MTTATGFSLPKRLTLPAIFLFAASSVPIAGIGVAMTIYLQPYMASRLGVPLMVVAGSWFTVRMLDFGIDVALGLVMDRFRSRWGRYRVWFVAGAPVLMAGIYMLFMAEPGIDQIYIVAWLFVFYLGTSMIGLAHAAWAATLVTTYNERSRVFGLMAPVGILGALIVLALPAIAEKTGHAADAVSWMGWFGIILMPITVAIVVMTTPERIAPEVAKHETLPIREYWEIMKQPSFLRLLIGEAGLVLGPGWMSALYVFFFTHSRGFTPGASGLLLMIYVVAGAIGAPAAAWLAIKIGKHNTLFATTTSYSLGLLTVLLIPKGAFLAAIPTMIWCGFMASGFGLMTRAMTADFGDEIRLQQGKERITMLYSFTALAAKVASAFAGVFTYAVLTWVGFNATEGAANTPEAIRGLELAYMIGPVVFVMLGGACFLGWNLDAKKHADIRDQLDTRDAALARAASGHQQDEGAPIIESVTGPG